MSEEFFFRYTNESGETIECEILDTFTNRETKRSYIIYTDHSHNEEDKIRIYAAIYDPDEYAINLYPIESEREWALVEEHIYNELLKDD